MAENCHAGTKGTGRKGCLPTEHSLHRPQQAGGVAAVRPSGGVGAALATPGPRTPVSESCSLWQSPHGSGFSLLGLENCVCSKKYLTFVLVLFICFLYFFKNVLIAA